MTNRTSNDASTNANATSSSSSIEGTTIATKPLSSSLLTNEEHAVDLYDEVLTIDEHGNTKKSAKPCTLKKNPITRFYWRILASLHEFGHSIARISSYFGDAIRCDKRKNDNYDYDKNDAYEKTRKNVELIDRVTTVL